MSHSTVLVVVPAAAVAQHGGDLDDALTEILEPFDENKDTPQYIRYTKAQLIENRRRYYERTRDEGAYAAYLEDPAKYAADCISRGRQEHLEYVSKELPVIFAERLTDEEWLYEDATKFDKESLDDEGNELSTYNPKSKWDWYQVGGRWSQRVMNWTDTVEHEAKVITPTWTEPAWTEKVGGVDYLQKKDLEQFAGTFAMLTADGEWHEQGRMGWFGMVSDEQEPDEWDAKLKQLVEDVADEDWLVVVDVHI
jgi:hypothetical protein